MKLRTDKEIYKTAQLDLPYNTSVCGTNTFNVNNTICFETESTLDMSKSYYFN